MALVILLTAALKSSFILENPASSRILMHPRLIEAFRGLRKVGVRVSFLHQIARHHCIFSRAELAPQIAFSELSNMFISSPWIHLRLMLCLCCCLGLQIQFLDEEVGRKNAQADYVDFKFTSHRGIGPWKASQA